MIPAAWVASMGGVIGPKTVKLLPWLAGAAIIAGLVIALLLTRNTLAGTKLELAGEKTAHRITIANYRIAQAQATIKAIEQRNAIEAKYRSKADESDDRHAAALASANDTVERFIAAGGLRPQGAQCAASGSASPAQGGSASVPAPVPADTLVSVAADDVRACAGAVAYALEAHRWALTLSAD